MLMLYTLEVGSHLYYPYSLIISEAAVVAKSNIVLEVKPWDDETDMKDIEKLVRAVEADGLVWGACECGVHE